MKRRSLTVIASSVILFGVSAASAGAASTLPATGQTTVYAAGDDGTYQTGLPLQFSSDGDGTVTDLNTGLMWETKDEFNGKPNSSDLHDVDNYYPWAGTCQNGHTLCGTVADCKRVSGTPLCIATDGQGTGYTIFEWVAQLNAQNFAGHNDWRIPNVKELQSIVDYGAYQPCVNSAFYTSCIAPCTLPTCSCTNHNEYWTATTVLDAANIGFFVNFNIGSTGFDNKKNVEYYVRAVR